MLQIEYRSLRSLIPYCKNARTHSAEQIALIKSSLVRLGWVNAMTIADQGMISGHGRLKAALELAAEGVPIPRNDNPWEGPVVDVSYLSDTDRAAHVIADNQLALMAGWDEELLSEEMGWLREEGFDLSLLGFDDHDLARLLSGTAPGDGPDPDDTPETPVHPVSQPGDVWTLGPHRLVCGDSTDPEAVRKCLNGIKPHLMVTDPPYGDDYDPSWRITKKNADGSLLSHGKHRALGVVQNDNLSDWTIAWQLFEGDVAYVWHSDRGSVPVNQSLVRAGFEVRSQIIWAKSKFVISRGHYHHQHEAAWYCVRRNRQAHWTGDKTQSTVWDIQTPPKLETGHSTQKPVECMERPILNNSSEGQAVYDPFVGSFTTGIACERTGRICHAIELSPAYVDVSIKRWEAFANGNAVHEETGLTYAEMSLARPVKPEAVA